jgi:hypothetical protein
MMYFVRRMLEIAAYPLRALFSTPNKLISGSQRLRQISLPARVAILTAIVLVIVAVAAVAYYIAQPDRAAVLARLGTTFWIAVPALVVIIPILLYKTLLLWLEGDASPYADIDRAWKAGVSALERQGIDLTRTPLFLVLGSGNERQEKAIFDATRFRLKVRETPKGPAALHWYGNAEGVYLVCSDASCTSRLSRLALETSQESARKAGAVADTPAASSTRGTVVAESPPRRDSARNQPAEELAAVERAAPRTADVRGTMVLSKHGSGVGSIDVANVPAGQVVKLPQQDASEQERRLEYVCRLMRRIRQPLCPINGIVTLLPFHLIHSSDAEAIELQRAVQRDLASLQKRLTVRCPVTALVIGLEEESGFQELVRRVGRDRVLNQRFGKGFLLANPPSSERMEAVCAHACGAFEEWVYALFREKGGLTKPDNRKLYALLCEIRRNVQGRLEGILANAFGFDADRKTKHQSLLFGGCYFAATGDSEDRQAFVKAVFDKLPEQQEELEWMDEALALDRRHQTLANVGFSIGTVLLLGLVGMVLCKYWL